MSSSDLAQVNADLDDAQTQVGIATGQAEVKRRNLPAAIFPSVAGQTYHTALFRGLITLVGLVQKPVCGDDAACQPCQAAQTMVVNMGRLATASEGITVPLSDGDRRTYLDFEVAASACLNNLPIAPFDSTPFDPSGQSKVLTSAHVYSAMSTASYGILIPYIAKISPQGTVGSYLAAVNASFNANYPKYDAAQSNALPGLLSDYLTAKGGISAATDRLKTFEDRAQRDKLGYYTVEEEADDLAVEWLSLAGFDPTVNAGTDLRLLSLDGDADNLAKCSASHQAHWTDSNGQPIILPWGPFGDPHPSSCFRVRNTDLEIASHGYPTGMASPAAGLSPSWTDLVAMVGGPLPAFALADAAAPAPPPPLKNKKPAFIRCRFAPKI